jgi:hypothetical protein
LDWTTKKLKCAERKEVTTAKKLTAAKAQCTVLAKLAQEWQKEGHLAHHQAESKVNAFHKETEKKLNLAACEIATAKRMSDDAVSNAHDKIIAERGFHLAKAKATAVTTHKRHTKELLLQQEECNIVVNDMKSKFRSTLKSNEKVVNDMKSEFKSTLRSNEKNHAKSTRIIQHEVKDAKSTVLAYATTISNLKMKVASFDATQHQLKKSHENNMMELALAHRSKVHTIHAHHASTIFEVKQKLRICMVSQRQLQNTLYNEVLDTHQHARVVSKSERLSNSLSSQ